MKRKHLSFWYGGIVLLLCIIAILFWALYLRFIEYTDDAYVEGNQIYITPLRDGFVKAINTDDTFFVKQGDLIVELDKTDAIIALEIAKKEYAKVVREVCQLFHALFATKENIDIRRAELIQAVEDFNHRQDVLAAEGVSLEDYQHSVAALRANYSALKREIKLFDQALAFLQGTTIYDHPLVQAAQSRVRYAYVQLYRSNIYAPVNGLVAQRTIQVGMWASSGTPMLSVIPLDQIWVNANFKETQVGKMKIGQKVKITSDLYGDDVVYQGHILGLPGAAGNTFSLLPPQNLSGNWIKIVQRLPIRVGLDAEEIKKHPLRLGLSMEATVDLSSEASQEAPPSPIYHTPIFDLEEVGDLKLINEIFENNVDHSLLKFVTEPLNLQRETIDPNLIPNEALIASPQKEEKYASFRGFPECD